jgi:hypothetical protein
MPCNNFLGIFMRYLSIVSHVPSFFQFYQIDGPVFFKVQEEQYGASVGGGLIDGFVGLSGGPYCVLKQPATYAGAIADGVFFAEV